MDVANQKDLGEIETRKATAEVVPLTMPEQRIEGPGEKYVGRAVRILESTKESAVHAFEKTRTQAAQTYSQAINRAKDLATRTQERARQAKQEHPVQLLATAFGAAFVVGIALRIWRSRTS